MVWPFENDTGAIVKKLAKRSLHHEKRRNTMVILAIALSAFLMSMCMAAVLTLAELKNNQAYDTWEAVYSNITQEDADALRCHPQIERVGKQYGIGNYESEDGYTASFTYLDGQMLYSGRNQIELTEGQAPAGINEIGAERRFLDKYAPGTQLGDTVTLYFDGEFIQFNLTAVLSTYDTGTETYGFLVSEDFLKSASDYHPKGYRAYVHFRNADHLSRDAVKESAVSVGKELGLGDISWNSLFFAGSASMLAENLLVLAALALIVLAGGYIVIQSIFRISVSEKIQSYGQLRTLGATKKQIRRIVKKESFRLSCAGIPAGLVPGIIVGMLLAGNTGTVELYLRTAVIVAVSIFAVCFALVRFSVEKPIKIASGASPMEAIRFVPFQGEVFFKNRKYHKVNLFRLALLNFSRDRRKAVSTSLSLFLGGLLLLISASLFGSYSPEQNARLAFPVGAFKIYLKDDNKMVSEQLESGSPMSEPLWNEILSADGVKNIAVARESVGGMKFDAGTGDGQGICDIITSGNYDSVSRALKRGRMPVNNKEILLPDFPEYAVINVGDPIQAMFDCSDTVIPVTVSGFCDLGVGKGNGALGLDAAGALITEGLAKELMPGIRDFSYTWEIVTDEAKNEEIEAELKKIVASYPGLSIYSFAEEVRKWKAQWNIITGGMQGISWLIFLFGVVNLVNITLSNQYSRKKEISMMRSVGLTQKQLYQMLITEGLFYVLISTVLMLTAGIPVSIIICNQMGRIMYDRSMVYRFPFVQIAAYLLVLLILEFILSAWSVKNGNRQSLVEQLREAD